MSCKDCELAQESDWAGYVRWGVANIQIKGCSKHMTEIMNVIREYQASKNNEAANDKN